MAQWSDRARSHTATELTDRLSSLTILTLSPPQLSFSHTLSLWAISAKSQQVFFVFEIWSNCGATQMDIGTYSQTERQKESSLFPGSAMGQVAQAKQTGHAI